MDEGNNTKSIRLDVYAGDDAGRLATLAELVRSGDISLEKAAPKAGLTTEEFCKRTKLPF